MRSPESRGFPVGGIAGGLYRLFYLLGVAFFSLLIGWRRASHPRLGAAAVRAGGVLVITPLSTLLSLRLVADTRDGPLWLMPVLALSFFGALAGFVLASILISYVDKVEREIAKEERFQRNFEQKYAELTASGASPEDAKEQAFAFAASKNSECFIATAVYGSVDAPEVRCFRRWRDQYLSKNLPGRLGIRLYYFASPGIAGMIRRSSILRSVAMASLEALRVRLTKDGD